MQNWWALAQAVLSAECPEFDIAKCFSAFDIARVEAECLRISGLCLAMN
jgi:hypothetical protein